MRSFDRTDSQANLMIGKTLAQYEIESSLGAAAWAKSISLGTDA